MENADIQERLANMRSFDMSILTLGELKRLNEILESMFMDEIDNWYNAIVGGDTLNGRAHHFCASILDMYIKDTHNRILGKVITRDII